MLEAQTWVEAVNGPLDEFLDRLTTTGVSLPASSSFGSRDDARASVAWIAQSLGGGASVPEPSRFDTLARNGRTVRSCWLEDT